MNVSISNKQFIFILFGAIIGYGIMGLPKVLAEQVGTGAWLSIIITTIIILVCALLMTYLNYIHKEKTLYEYSELLLGKVLSKIVIVIYILYFVGILTAILKLTGEIIRYTILPKTPVEVLCLSLIILIVFAVSKGLGNIVKFCVLTGIFVLFIALASHIIVFSKAQAVNLQPVLGTGNVLDYFKGAGVAALSFVGVETLLLVPQSEQNNKKIFAVVGITIAAIGLFYIFITMSCIGVMSTDSIVYYRDALMATIRRVTIDKLDFLKRLDGIGIIGWILAVLTTMILVGYGAVSLTDKLTKSKSYNWVAIIMGVLVFVGTLFVSDFEKVREYLNYLSYGIFFTSAFIPILLIIISKAKGYGKKKA